MFYSLHISLLNLIEGARRRKTLKASTPLLNHPVNLDTPVKYDCLEEKRLVSSRAISQIETLSVLHESTRFAMGGLNTIEMTGLESVTEDWKRYLSTLSSHPT